MAHNTSKTGFPDIPILPGMILRLEARSLTTDSAVTGVTSTRWSIYGRDESGGAVEDVTPVYQLDSDETASGFGVSGG